MMKKRMLCNKPKVCKATERDALPMCSHGAVGTGDVRVASSPPPTQKSNQMSRDF